eukprot:355627-Chlamydomonas_euryale.AAC.5
MFPKAAPPDARTSTACVVEVVHSTHPSQHTLAQARRSQRSVGHCHIAERKNTWIKMIADAPAHHVGPMHMGTCIGHACQTSTSCHGMHCHAMHGHVLRIAALVKLLPVQYPPVMPPLWFAVAPVTA